MKGCQDYTLYQSGFARTFSKILHKCLCACVCETRDRKGKRIEEAIIMPATTVVGSREKRRKEQGRLCLELSKCSSSGPHSLYQCHSRAFSSHLSAQWLLFRPLRAGKNTWSPTMAGSTQSTTFFFSFTPCTYPAYGITSLKITLCLNAFSPFFSIAQRFHICAECWKFATLHLLYALHFQLFT